MISRLSGRSPLPLSLIAGSILACSISQITTSTPAPPTSESHLPTIPLHQAPHTVGGLATAYPLSQLPTSTVEPQTTRVQFEPGTTSEIMAGHLEQGDVERYVLRASVGQIMEVVVTSSKYDVLLGIWGADGTVLKICSDDTLYWRGELPSTQDYFVEVASVGEETDYTLTVSISALDRAADWQIYRSDKYKFEVRYPPAFTVDTPPFRPSTARGDVEVSLRLTGSEYYSGTNLADAYVIISATQDGELVSACLELNNGERYWGEEKINSITFHKSSWAEGAAGHIYEEIAYCTVYQNTCYEIVWLIHSTNIGVYSPGTVSEWDREKVMGRLEQVLFTFKLLD